MNTIEGTAAENLTGLVLDDGWRVIEKLTNTKPSLLTTGGSFSVSYAVEKDGEIAFLKALDFALAFNSSSRNSDFTKELARNLEIYNHEKDILQWCAELNLDKITRIISSGQLSLSDFPISIVPYIIMEKAEADSRHKIRSFNDKLEFIWKCQSLHQVSVGLWQLHKNQACMQDLKPSNVLVFEDTSKIGDLGRAITNHKEHPFKEYIFTGDRSYSPPEIMYNYTETGDQNYQFYHDIYMLGNLSLFYFTGLNMTSLIATTMFHRYGIQQFSYRGQMRYSEISAAVEDVYSSIIAHLSSKTSQYPKRFSAELINLIKNLCHPHPSLRGHINMHKRPLDKRNHLQAFQAVVSMCAKLLQIAKISIRNEQ